MLSEQDLELAHPEAFDFAFGTLPADQRAGFAGHLAGCPHCQAVVTEYRDIGEVIKTLPPQAEPSADLEDRTIDAVMAALSASTEPQTLIQERPQFEAAAAAQDATWPRPSLAVPPEPEAPAVTAPPATALPVRRRHRGRLAVVVAAAAAIIIAAIVVPLSLAGGRAAPAQATVVIALHATAGGQALGFAAATGHATAHRDASGSWDITLTVQHLKHHDPVPWYGCWYKSADGLQVASAGTFLVPASGTGTFAMTSAVDPHDFPVMEITIQSPNKNGALAGTVILSGQIQ